MDAPVTRRLWLESPLWDSFWLLSGLWLLGILLVAEGLGYVPRVPDLLALGGFFLLWGGHILSPMVASWSNRDLRAHMIQHRGKFVVFPLVLLVLSTLLGALGDVSRPVLFYAALVWNTWHSGAQHFGVLAIYRNTAGQSSRRDRQLDRWFSIGMTCILLPLAWYSQDRKDRLGQLFSYLPAPSDFSDLGTVIIVISAVLTVAFVALEASKRNASLPRALYVLSIGIQPVFGTIAYPLYHVAIFSICHWMIACGLASRILGSQGSASRWILGRGQAMWLLLLVMLSAVMFLMFRTRVVPDVFGPLAYSAVTGVYFGINFVHFAYDRYLYAFSRPEIRQWVAPALFQRDDLGLRDAVVPAARMAGAAEK